MLKNVSLGKELVVSLPNKAGILADISKILADHGINIEGVAGYVQGDDAKIMIVAEDDLRAKEALGRGGYKAIKENEVLVLDLENKPGALKVVMAKLASEGIDIRYAYGTACSSGCPSRIIVATSANEKALVSLKG